VLQRRKDDVRGLLPPLDKNLGKKAGDVPTSDVKLSTERCSHLIKYYSEDDDMDIGGGFSTIPHLNLTGALDTTIELDKIFKLHGAVHLEELQIIVLAGNHKFYYLQYGNPSSFHQLYIEFSLAKGFSTSERKITAALQIFYGRWLATDLTGEIIPDAENGLHDTNTHRQNILPVDPALMEELRFFSDPQNKTIIEDSAAIAAIANRYQHGHGDLGRNLAIKLTLFSSIFTNPRCKPEDRLQASNNVRRAMKLVDGTISADNEIQEFKKDKAVIKGVMGLRKK